MKKFSLLFFLLTYCSFIWSQPPNDECTGAIPLSLGDTIPISFSGSVFSTSPCDDGFQQYDVWYQINGFDGTLHLTVEGAGNNFVGIDILSGDCDNLSCLPRTIVNKNYATALEPDKTYFINVYAQNSIPLNGSFQLSTYSSTPPINNTFDQATLITCSDTLDGTIRYALADRDLNRSFSPSLWYQVVGTGEFTSISANYNGVDFGPAVRFYVWRDGKLTDFSNNPYGYGSENEYNFLKQDSTYYINVAGNYTNTIADFRISASCISIVDNDICSAATAVSITDTIRGGIEFSWINSDGDCHNDDNDSKNSDVWYRFKGDNSLRNFILESDNPKLSYTLYKGSCEALECVDNLAAFSNAPPVRGYLEEGEDYFIKVFSINRYNNKYSFKLYTDKIPIATNDLCSTASLLSCGSIIRDSLDFATSNDLLCDGSTSEDKGIWYKITGTNQYYEINASSLSPLLFKGDCGTLVCIQDSLLSYQRKSTFFAHPGEEYYLFFTRYTSKIEFDVSCIDPKPSNLLVNAIGVNCGNQITGYAFDASFTPISPCEGQDEADDIWFKIAGNNEFFYYEEKNKSRFAPWGVYTLVEDELLCFDRFTDDKRIFLPIGTDYYLRLYLRQKSTSSSLYDFDFEFTCAPKVTNDECSTAQELSCGDQVVIDNTHATNDEEGIEPCGGNITNRPLWFKIEGNDSWQNLKIVSTNGTALQVQTSAYVGSCGELSCLPQSRIFYAETGKTYYIKVRSSSRLHYGEFAISLSCERTAVNDLCHDAIPLMCGDTIRSTVDYATLCDYADPCVNGFPQKQVWYEVNGTGELMYLQLNVEAHNDHTADIEIYNDNCCQLQPIINTYGTQHAKYFQTKENETYLLAVSLSAVADRGGFELIIDCVDTATINICENAANLSNNQQITFDRTKGVTYKSDQSWANGGVDGWVRFTGSGGHDTLKIVSPNTSGIRTSFYIDRNKDCQLSSKLGLQDVKLSEDVNPHIITFATLEGIDYVVGIKTSRLSQDISTEVQVSLRKATSPNNCSVSVPENITAVHGEEIEISYAISGTGNSFYATLDDDTDSYVRNGPRTGRIRLTPRTANYKVLEFYAEGCRGHGFTDVVITGLPVLDCPNIGMRELPPNIRGNQSIVSDIPRDKRQNLPEIGAPKTDSFFPEEVKSSFQPQFEKDKLQVVPNPFSQNAILHFYLEENTSFALKLYDTNGNLVLHQSPQQANKGWNTSNLSASGLASGVYHLSLRTKKDIWTRRVVVIN